MVDGAIASAAQLTETRPKIAIAGFSIFKLLTIEQPETAKIIECNIALSLIVAQKAPKISNSPYAEDLETLTPNPSPSGRGEKSPSGAVPLRPLCINPNTG
jgi:hypothetical protein